MYAIVTCINGNFEIEAEGLNEQQAKVLYHQKCAAFWNASDVLLGQVSILNQQLQVVGGQLNIPVYSEENVKDVVGIARRAMSVAMSKLNDVVILDTAGRLHVDEELMQEL